jgi:acyl-ACP thioesterase
MNRMAMFQWNFIHKNWKSLDWVIVCQPCSKLQEKLESRNKCLVISKYYFQGTVTYTEKNNKIVHSTLKD